MAPDAAQLSGVAAATVVPLRVTRRASGREEGVRRWFDEDHPISRAILVPAGLAGLIALLLLAYALLGLS